MSSESEATLLPSEEEQTVETLLLWPYKVWISEPFSKSQIFNVLSSEQETTLFPSKEKQTELTFFDDLLTMDLFLLKPLLNQIL